MVITDEQKQTEFDAWVRMYNNRPRIKPLVAKFSYNALQDVMERERWRLPTSDELRDANYTDHVEVWVSDTHHEDGYAYLYNTRTGKRIGANKSFKLHVAVVKE